MFSFVKTWLCVVNDDKKIQIFLVRTRPFVHLNDQYVLNGGYVKDTS